MAANKNNGWRGMGQSVKFNEKNKVWYPQATFHDAWKGPRYRVRFVNGSFVADFIHTKPLLALGKRATMAEAQTLCEEHYARILEAAK